MRHVWMLALTQALCASGSFLVVLLGGILGSQLAPTPVLATLPVSVTIAGLAVSVLPAGMLMRRHGRRRVFIASALIAALACAGAAWAIAAGEFWGFCFAVFFLGGNNALVMQYRFAATEYVEPSQGSRAISAVMTGALVAAWLGPELGVRAAGLVESAYYAGSFLSAGGLYLLAAALLARVPDSMPPALADDRPARPLREIARQPEFQVAVLAALASYAVMSFIMTATPISMHVIDLHGEADTKFVIQSHLLAMYLPSLFSGWFVARIGIRPSMVIGAALMSGCIAVAVGGGHAVVHYWWAMVLLGTGWNLLFVAGTTLLTHCYRPHERFHVQAANDFAVFGSQAAASLMAGLALATIGWQWLNAVSLPLLLAVLVSALRLGRWPAPGAA